MKFKEYIKPTPELKSLFNKFFKAYQFYHHGENWKDCPRSILRKVDRIISSIKVPKSPNENANIILEKFRKELDTLSSDFTSDLSTTCYEFYMENPVIFTNNLQCVISNHIVLALIMTKKWAKKTYKKINHSIINDMCEMLNESYPANFKILYINNFIIDQSDTLSTPVDSEDSIEEPTEDVSDATEPVTEPENTPLPLPEVKDRHTKATSHTSVAKKHVRFTSKSDEPPHQNVPSDNPFDEDNCFDDSGFDSFRGNSTPVRRHPDWWDSDG